MGAKGAGDKRQRVLIKYDGERLFKSPRPREPDILRHILPDRAALLTGGDEAVRQGDGPLYLSVRSGLRRLSIFGGERRQLRKFFDLFVVNAAKRRASARVILVGKLFYPLITAWLQQSGGDRDRPNAGAVEQGNIFRISAARPRDAQLSAKVVRKTPRRLKCQREERAS